MSSPIASDLTIACVFRSGGDFGPEWVHALRRGLNIWAPKGHRFVCLTDDPRVGIWGVRLEHDWPGWWSKVELFRPGLFRGRVLYMDLDTLPVGDLGDLCSYGGPLAMLRGFYRRSRSQSGVMAFTAGEVTESIWEAWTADPGAHMANFRGDGEWLHSHTSPDYLQDLYHGQVVTLKPIYEEYPDPVRHGPPEGARLVCGHGRPRLSDPAAGWAYRLWRDRVGGVRIAA